MAKYIQPRRKYLKSRKYNGFCECCKTKVEPNLIFSRADESNVAITYNAPYLCYFCYRDKYQEVPVSLTTYLRLLGFESHIEKLNNGYFLHVDDKVVQLTNSNKDDIIKRFTLKKQQQKIDEKLQIKILNLIKKSKSKFSQSVYYDVLNVKDMLKNEFSSKTIVNVVNEKIQLINHNKKDLYYGQLLLNKINDTIKRYEA